MPIAQLTYRFPRTKTGDWRIAPAGEDRWVLHLQKPSAGERAVDEFGSPEAAAATVGRIETSEFAPEAHWRTKEQFDLHLWEIDTRRPVKRIPDSSSIETRESSWLERLQDWMRKWQGRTRARDPKRGRT